MPDDSPPEPNKNQQKEETPHTARESSQIDPLLSSFILAVGEASARARGVVYILVIAVVVAFSVYYNDWSDDRSKLASDALYYGLWYPGIQQMPDVVTRRDVNMIVAFEHHFPWSAYGQATNTFELQKVVENPDFRRARSFAKNKQFSTLLQLQRYLENIEDIRSKNRIYFLIPVFNTGFDVNDLGLVTGFSFTFILIMLRATFSRYLQNLKLAFGKADELDRLRSSPEHLSLTTCYELMSMQQILTVPPQNGPQELWPWRFVPRILYLLPLVVQTIIAINDGKTLPVGENVNSSMSVIQLIIDVVFVVITFTLTYSSMLLSWQTDAEWRKRAQEIGYLSAEKA